MLQWAKSPGREKEPKRVLVRDVSIQGSEDQRERVVGLEGPDILYCAFYPVYPTWNHLCIKF